VVIVSVSVVVGGIVEVRMKVSKTVVVMVAVVVVVLGSQGVKIQEPQIGQRSIRGMMATRRCPDIVDVLYFLCSFLPYLEHEMLLCELGRATTSPRGSLTQNWSTSKRHKHVGNQSCSQREPREKISLCGYRGSSRVCCAFI
jgi:hypothetical protein